MMMLTRTIVARVLLIVGLLLPAGCSWLGYAASSLPQKVVARYKGLAGQSVGVMVWDDQALRMDWGSKLQVDLASAVQGKLVEAAKPAAEVEELKGTTFPVDPRSIVRYQRDHPQIEAMNILEVVPKFGVSRVIYIELNDLQTHAPASADLYRGSASANVRVLEIKDGKATIGYAEDNIEAVYPPKTPPEGTPHGSIAKMYVGTIDDLSTQIAQRFFTYEE